MWRTAKLGSRTWTLNTKTLLVEKVEKKGLRTRSKQKGKSRLDCWHRTDKPLHVEVAFWTLGRHWHRPQAPILTIICPRLTPRHLNYHLDEIIINQDSVLPPPTSSPAHKDIHVCVYVRKMSPWLPGLKQTIDPPTSPPPVHFLPLSSHSFHSLFSSPPSY